MANWVDLATPPHRFHDGTAVGPDDAQILARHAAPLRQKEEALAKVTPLDMPLGRFRPDGELLAFLEGP
jgi:hypothetical protein